MVPGTRVSGRENPLRSNAGRKGCFTHEDFQRGPQNQVACHEGHLDAQTMKTVVDSRVKGLGEVVV